MEVRSPLLVKRLEEKTLKARNSMSGPERISLGPHSERVQRTSTPDDDVSPDILFMQGQLLDFAGNGPEDQYETLRLEGERLSAEGTRAVHVYEMFWSDLARVGSGFLDPFVELYQVLFHLPSLGEHAVDYGRENRPYDLLWRAYAGAQFWASRLLTIGVPVLHMLLLVVATSFLPACLEPLTRREPSLAFSSATLLAWGGVALGIIAGAAHLTFHNMRHRHLILPAAILLTVAACAGVSFAPPLYVLFVEWLVIAFVLISLPLRAYDRRHPGALATGLTLMALLALFITVDSLLERGSDVNAIVTRSLRSVEVVNATLSVVWISYLTLQLIAFFLGFVAARRERRADVRALTRTARLSLAIPTVLFLLITIPLSSMVYGHLAELMPKAAANIEYEAWFPPLARDGKLSVPAFVSKLVALGATDGFIVVITFAIGALLVTGLLLLPVVLAEVVPPKADPPISKSSHSKKPLAEVYGTWLSFALKGLSVAAFAVVFAATLGLPIGVGLLLCHVKPIAVTKLLDVLTLALTGSAIGFLGLRGRLDSLALGFRPALDAVLDVDTYLREHPRDATPRARICARYISLLRYLHAWHDPGTGRPYDAIVIVAHSQGTVITADLLRFLQLYPDVSFAPGSIPIVLFTMGSPLRQLYSAHLPDLYAWLGERSAGVSTLDNDAKPHPYRDLGVVQWVNAYRSGDYVGRAVWRNESEGAWQCASSAAGDDAWLVTPTLRAVAESPDGLRREFCVGPGAHTHYWDAHGSLVAAELDRIVCQRTPLA
jgi:hypothetical protein